MVLYLEAQGTYDLIHNFTSQPAIVPTTLLTEPKRLGTNTVTEQLLLLLSLQVWNGYKTVINTLYVYTSVYIYTQTNTYIHGYMHVAPLIQKF